DFQSEINNRLPFSLISNDTAKNELVIMPGYWFEYNFYALARNSEKLAIRDGRSDKRIYLEYDYLAPDTVNEMLEAITLLASSTGQAYAKKKRVKKNQSFTAIGNALLQNNPAAVDQLTLLLNDAENSHRPVRLTKVNAAYRNYHRLIRYYCVKALFAIKPKGTDWMQYLINRCEKVQKQPAAWVNVGGQLLPEQALDQLMKNICAGKISSWDQIHDWYRKQSDRYQSDKVDHALSVLLLISNTRPSRLSRKAILSLVDEAEETEAWIMSQIKKSREKDYQNPFRKMLYTNEKEMEQVMGKLDHNPFIKSLEAKQTLFFQQTARVKLLLAGKKS
ncbi:MAG: DUF4954 family protein, partial [Bacteroidetes bacterium]|nr:DUF4954 family protein [Bacteroidota bacterium]